MGKNVGVVFIQTSKFCLPTGYLVSLSRFLPLYKEDRYPPHRARLKWMSACSVTQSSVHDSKGWWPWLRLTHWVWWFNGSPSLCQHYPALVGCLASPNCWPEASPLWGSLYCNSFLSQVMEISGSQEAETSQKGFALPLSLLYQMYHPGSSVMKLPLQPKPEVLLFPKLSSPGGVRWYLPFGGDGRQQRSFPRTQPNLCKPIQWPCQGGQACQPSLLISSEQ